MNPNLEFLLNAKWKLKREYDKKKKMIGWFEDKDKEGRIAETLTLGTDENIPYVITPALLSFGSFALGAGVVGVGIVVGLITMEGPMTQAEIEVFEKLETFVNNCNSFSTGSFSLAKNLLLASLGVTAISLPKRIYREIVTRIDEKNEWPQLIKKETVRMIDDILDRKQDESLSFPTKFLERVNLTENSREYNLLLVKSLAKYRYLRENVGKDDITEETVKEAYDEFITFIDQYKDTEYASDRFRNNRFVRLLLEKSKENEEVEGTMKK